MAAKTLRVIPLAVLVAAAFAASAHAELRTTHVAGNVYMISGAGANVAVSVGKSGILTVDSGSAANAQQLLAEIRKTSHGALRYIIDSSVAPDHVGGNETLGNAGATFTGGNATVVGGVDVGAAIIAHEATLLRMSSTEGVSVNAQPTETFYVPKYDLYFNEEPVLLMYEPNALDDTNVAVHFRRSDVIATGDVFRMDGYPVIDLAHGGSIDGVLAAVNSFIDLAVSDTLSEGGTLLIPGHGRICDEGDLVRYRDMVTIIRDRIEALKKSGKTLAQVKAAKPTLDYDSRWGATTGAWTTDKFIEVVFASVGT
jgi:glyoxylase-like metal-dependent hydrolase (beta-lactamase superfamily II)